MKLDELKKAKKLIVKNIDILISPEEEQLYLEAIQAINKIILDYKKNYLI